MCTHKARGLVTFRFLQLLGVPPFISLSRFSSFELGSLLETLADAFNHIICSASQLLSRIFNDGVAYLVHPPTHFYGG